jgi:murein DD-endopeptidase MepM/ murein hydrolase activator NlpD
MAPAGAISSRHVRLLLSLAWGLLAVAPRVAVAADAVEVEPGTVVRWTAPGTQECGEAAERWRPIGDTCYFPIDLDRSGELELLRRRENREESYRVVIGDYPYRVQHIQLKDSRRVDLAPEDLARSQAERARIDALWALDTPPRFELPLSAPVADPRPGGSFGSKRYFNGKPRSPHSGEDYKATEGTAVFAAAPGVVKLAEEHFFGGRSVYLDHGAGLVSMYMHLSEIEVSAGEQVSAGQRIGRAGSTGRATGPHLHFGLRWRGARVDPAVLLAD